MASDMRRVIERLAAYGAINRGKKSISTPGVQIVPVKKTEIEQHDPHRDWLRAVSSMTDEQIRSQVQGLRPSGESVQDVLSGLSYNTNRPQRVNPYTADIAGAQSDFDKAQSAWLETVQKAENNPYVGKTDTAKKWIAASSAARDAATKGYNTIVPNRAFDDEEYGYWKVIDDYVKANGMDPNGHLGYYDVDKDFYREGIAKYANTPDKTMTTAVSRGEREDAAYNAIRAKEYALRLAAEQDGWLKGVQAESDAAWAAMEEAKKGIDKAEEQKSLASAWDYLDTTTGGDPFGMRADKQRMGRAFGILPEVGDDIKNSQERLKAAVAREAQNAKPLTEYEQWLTDYYNNHTLLGIDEQMAANDARIADLTTGQTYGQEQGSAYLKDAQTYEALKQQVAEGMSMDAFTPEQRELWDAYESGNGLEWSNNRYAQGNKNLQTATIENEVLAANRANIVQQRNYQAAAAQPDFKAKSVRDTAQTDELYNFINDRGGKGERANEILGIATTLVDEGKWLDKGYGFLDRNEIDYYNYIVKTQGLEAGQRVLDELAPELALRRAKDVAEDAKQFAEDYGGWSTLATYTSNLASGITAPLRAIDAIVNPDHSYLSSMYDNQVFTDKVREVRGAEWGKATDKWQISLGDWKMEFGPELGQWLYGLQTSGGDMITAMAVGKGVQLAGGSAAAMKNTVQAIMSSEAGGATMYRAMEQGIDPRKAVVLGLGSAAIEALTEKYSIEELLKKPDLIRTYLGQNMLTEATEEGASNLLNLAWDTMVLGDQGDIMTAYSAALEANGGDEQKAARTVLLDKLAELGLDVLGGAVMGGGMASLPAASTAVKRGKVGKTINTNGTYNQLRDIAAAMDKDTAAYKIASETTKDGKISNAQAGRLYSALMESLDERSAATIKEAQVREVTQRLRDLGESGNIGAAADAIQQLWMGRRLTGEQRRAIASTEYGQQVINELLGVDDAWAKGAIERVGQVRREGDMTTMRARHLASKSFRAAENAEASKLVAKDAATTYQNAAEETEYNAKATVDGKEGEITGIKDVVDGAPVFTVQVGDQVQDVALADLQVDSYNMAVVADAMKGMTAQAANEMLGFYKASGINGAAFARGWKTAYNAGRTALGMEYVNTNSAASVLPQSAKETAYRAGEQQYQGEKPAAQETAPKAPRGKGKVTFEKGTDLRTSKLTRGQRSAIGVTRMLAQVTGINFRFYQSTADKEGRYTGANGYYDPKTNTIALDLNAGKNSATDNAQFAILRTASHELTHYIARNSQDMYRRLQTFVLDNLIKRGKSMDLLIADQIARAKENGITLSEAEAIEEVVADACEMMLRDSKAIETLAEKDHGLFVHIRNWLRKFYGQLKQAFDGLGASRAEALGLQDKDADGIMRYIDGLQELWDQALVDAVEGQQRTQKDSSGQEGTKYALRDSSGKVINLSEETLEENKRYVANMEPVVALEGNPMEKNPDKDFETMGIEYFASIGGKAVNPILGNIALDKEGISHLIGRKLTWRKAALLRAVKPVLEQGRIMFIDNNHNGTPIDTAVIAAMVTLDGTPYYMGVVVSQNPERNNRYEVHDAVVVQKNRRDIITPTKTPSADEQRRGRDNVPPIAIILSELANYNTQFSEKESFSLRSPTENQTDTQEFKRWFGNSKVVDAEGKPLVLYHGSPSYSRFNVFRKGKRGYLGPGIYLTDKEWYAQGYSEKNGPGGQMYALYARMEKPLYVTSLVEPAKEILLAAYGSRAEGIYRKRKAANEFDTYWVTSADIKKLQAFGYDGIIWGTEKSSTREYMVFDPTQIKSATDNIGTFDPENPDIRFQARDYSALSEREILAGADPNAVKNSGQRQYLTEYQKSVRHLINLNDRLTKYQQEYIDAGDRNAQIEAKNRIDVVTGQIQRQEEKLAKMEARPDFQPALQLARQTLDDYLAKTDAGQIAKDIESTQDEYRKTLLTKASAAKERLERTKERMRDTQSRSALRDRIKRKVHDLDKILRTDSDSKHVPEELKGATAEFLKAFLNNTRVFKDADLLRLWAAYTKITDKTADPSPLSSMYDENIELMLDELRSTLDGQKLVDLSADALKDVLTIVDHFSHIIGKANADFIKARGATIAEAGGKVIDQADSSKRSKGIDNYLVNMLREGMATPVYFFKRIGGEMKRLFDDLMDAQSKTGLGEQQIRNFFLNTAEKYHYWDWADNKNDLLKMTTKDGKTVTLDREQALYLYSTWKRENSDNGQQAGHLREGGFVYEDAVKQNKKTKEMSIDTTNPNRMTDEDMAKVVDWLTAEQKAYADEMVRFMSEDMAAVGNKVSMTLYGYEKFGEPYYFPYNSSRNYINTPLGQGAATDSSNRLKHWSAAKKTVQFADNPIILGSFTKTWSDHVIRMNLYGNMCVPLENFNRVYNYKYRDEVQKVDADGEPVFDRDGNPVMVARGEAHSVKASLEGAYGKQAMRYIEKLMNDLNGGIRTQDTFFGSKLFSNFKKTAVGLSLSVVVQQPSSMVRAMALVNPKYFLPGVAKSGSWDELKKYSGVAVIKEVGGFDTATGASTRSWLTSRKFKLRDLLDKDGAKAIGKELVKKDTTLRSDLMGYLPAKADQVTWTHIWRAVKAEVAETTGMDTGSEAFLEAAAKRFEEVITYTQVYDSVLAKSQMMRSNNDLEKMATSFMSEPTLTYNMLADAVVDTVKNGRKGAAHLARALAAWMATALVNALHKSIVTAMRDDDDKHFAEKYITDLVDNFTDDINVFNMVPYARDIISLMQGYDVERGDMTLVSDLIDGFKKAFDDDEMPMDERIKALAFPLANIFGIPAKNVYRDGSAIVRTFRDIIDGEGKEFSSEGLKYSLLELLAWYDGKTTAYYGRLLDAYMSGNTAEQESLMTYLTTGLGKTEKNIRTQTKTELGNRYKAGKISEEDAIEMLTDYFGVKDTDAYWTVKEWREKAEFDKTNEDEDEFKFARTGELQSALASGNNQTINAAKDELVKNGYTEKSVQSDVKSEVKNLYKQGKINFATARKLLETHGSDEFRNKETNPEKRKTRQQKLDNEWYWLEQEYNYAKANYGKEGVEAWNKYDRLDKAIDTGRDLKAAAKELLDHGSEKSNIGSHIKNKYKDTYASLYKTNKTKALSLLEKIVDAYIAIGYKDRKKQAERIKKEWLE